MRVSILGVLVGGVVDVGSSFLAGIPFALYFVSRLEPSQRVGPHASEALSAAMHANVLVYATELLTGLLCSALGGYISAAIAKRHERLNGMLSCYLCVGLGVIAVCFGLDKDPRWLQVLLFLASPALAFVGGDIRFRQRLRAAADS